jgi:hypothetical protein
MFLDEYNHILVQIVCIYICNESMKNSSFKYYVPYCCSCYLSLILAILGDTAMRRMFFSFSIYMN